ncbi:hypothetical protein DNTS_035813 [Danionella cerebrum]|uniref:DH domain-containing protein n=1 Tax=Danionella cerebrum TaxID=2873325 RepID=A0A553Q3D8_9TELE|nr:hypothetical protein DNTS_035813 [Danionella translucida]
MPETYSSTHDVPMAEESPRLSLASVGSNDRASTATLSDCSDITDLQRPVSIVSTISSGSGSSRDDILPSSVPNIAVPNEDSVGLELTPADLPNETHASSQQENCNINSTSESNNSTPFAANTMAPNPELTYLDRVVMEILETERMYVRDLRSIVEDYLAYIIDTGDLPIKPEQVCALFGNIEDIYEFNSELLQSLDMCDGDPVAIARCFVIQREYFDIYTQYCTNYPNSVAALTDCMRNKTLAKFFRERQATLKRTLPLGSYLLKPVQRILKYHLLLQEIAKHFDPEEDGYEVVEEAIYTMTGVAWYINDMKRKHEHAVRLQEVQSLLINWKGPDLTTYGELVLEGTFRVHRAKNERTLFLFDRMLLITKRRGEHYVYKTHISCSTLMLIESAKDSLCFSVTHYKHPKQPHTVQARTVEEKKLWAHHIKRLILENHQAVIPQKAKEAILEMDSIYKKYKYSPERLKKSGSCQPEELANPRQDQKPSAEPSKDILKDTKEGSEFLENHFKRNGTSVEQVDVYIKDECFSEQEKSQDPTLPYWGTTEKFKPGDSCDTEPVAMDPLVPNDQDKKAGSDTDDQKGSKGTTEECMTLLQKIAAPGDSSEEEEDVEEKPVSASILPSSVLDKASSIAEHFTMCSPRRTSTSGDEVRSFSCQSPRLPSRTGSTLSLRDGHERQHRLASTCSETQETLASVDFTNGTSVEDAALDCDQSILKRRDSILSRQEQILIDKIRSYYESAEHQDASFSLKRRESLSYIPSGLVRNSVSRFNSIPNDKVLESTTGAFAEDTQSPLGSVETEISDVDHAIDSPVFDSVQAASDLEEVFRPSSEMIRAWQEMEKGFTRTQGAQILSETLHFRGASPSLCRKGRRAEVKFGDGLLEDSDLSTIKEEPSLQSPSVEKGKMSAFEDDVDKHHQWEDERRPIRALPPRVAQLRLENEYERGAGAQSAEDGDSSQNKVFNLARKFSQRIKCTQPMSRQRSQEPGDKESVVEESPEEAKGKPNMMLSMTPDNQPATQSPSPTSSPQALSPLLSNSRSPLSPTPCESFNWPDVRELRSKYSHLGSITSQTSVTRSHSVVGRRSSCSSSHLIPSADAPVHKPRLERDPEEVLTRTQRAGSLDQKLGSLILSDLHILQRKNSRSGYYVSAQATLPNDKRIIVIEKIPEVKPTAENTKELTSRDESYVQICSPTSHEKISIMAVIDRCRAYQESEEYSLREEGICKGEEMKHKEKAASFGENDHDPAKNAVDSGKTDAGKNSIVKNLREKFQNIK